MKRPSDLVDHLGRELYHYALIEIAGDFLSNAEAPFGTVLGTFIGHVDICPASKVPSFGAKRRTYNARDVRMFFGGVELKSFVPVTQITVVYEP